MEYIEIEIKEKEIEEKIKKCTKELQKLREEKLKLSLKSILEKQFPNYREKIIEMLECRIKSAEIHEYIVQKLNLIEDSYCEKCSNLPLEEIYKFCPFATVCIYESDDEFKSPESCKKVLKYLKGEIK